jgi:prepilin-type N-terminal cleavage/methylation domain-containing protein
VVRQTRREHGFTLIEMVVAMLILAVVLTALAPAFYGSLTATSSSGHRSVANGLAVTANEQLRSLPYYEVTYQTGDVNFTNCPATGSAPVTSSTAGPVDSLSTSQTIGAITYHFQRCLYWMDATSNAGTADPQAYKQSVVTVTWSDRAGTNNTVTESSDIYPGGKGVYNGVKSNYAPPQATTTTLGPAPGPPTITGATASATGAITVTWTAPTSGATPTGYIVEYNTTGNFSSGLYASSPVTNSSKGGVFSWTPTGLTPGSLYYFSIVALSGGAQSVAATTQVTTSTSGALTTCAITNLVVNPTQAQVNSYGYLQGSGQFALSINANSYCTSGSGLGSSVWVYYTSSSSTLQSIQMTGTGGMLNAEVGLNPDGSLVAWTPGNHTFTVYVGSGGNPPTPYNSGSTFVQVNICQPNPVTGVCS